MSSPTSSLTDRRAARWMIAPAILVLATVALYPVVAGVWLSLHRAILVFHENRFIGLENYAFMARDPRFWSALRNTAYFSVVAVAVELVLGMCFALLLDVRAHASHTAARSLLRASILVPWAIPTVVSAKLWAWLFNQDYGLLTRAVPGASINWLGSPGYAMHAAIVVDVWKTTPFVTFLLLAGLVTIPREVYEASEIDGASRLHTFLRVTLPMLKPTLAVTLIFRTLDAFRVFDAVYVLTEGGPANTTETLSIYAYKTLMRTGDFGYGSALSFATFACVMALSMLYLRLLGDGARGP
ncbi:MAG TPA: sugar ABC transporter permease [Polyangiaceae bacterium]